MHIEGPGKRTSHEMLKFANVHGQTLGHLGHIFQFKIDVFDMKHDIKF